MPFHSELENHIKEIIRNHQEREKKILCDKAFFSENAKRRINEKEDHRPAFVRDADRIIHSFSYARFMDKTQVFFWIQSDIHQHRMLHVQLVSKLSRYVARVLKLNEDLVEAIALGHDIGHVPFGHDGEMVLDKICREKGIGRFCHNYEGVWFLQEIEMQNLTLPVVDGILCHNGETHKRILTPQRETLSWEEHEKEMERLRKGDVEDLIPKTLEGCLVRIVDTISYISRDVLDAENLGFLKFDEIPQSVKETLGRTNREIINTLVNDLIFNSLENNLEFLSYSKDVFRQIEVLYEFNKKRIYLNEEKLSYIPKIEKAFRAVWEYYYEDLISEKKDSRIFRDHLSLNLKFIQQRYPHIKTLRDYDYTRWIEEAPEIVVRDFIAGMTDQYFWKVAEEIDKDLVFHPRIIY